MNHPAGRPAVSETLAPPGAWGHDTARGDTRRFGARRFRAGLGIAGTVSVAEQGLTDVEELVLIGNAWHEWAASPDGWFAVPSGELIARPA